MDTDKATRHATTETPLLTTVVKMTAHSQLAGNALNTTEEISAPAPAPTGPTTANASHPARADTTQTPEIASAQLATPAALAAREPEAPNATPVPQDTR